MKEDNPLKAGPIGRVGGEDGSELGELVGEDAEKGPAGPPAPTPPPAEARWAITVAVLLYAACSSSLLLINKVSMHLMPSASFLLFCQFTSSALWVRFLLCAWPDTDVELLIWDKVKKFAPATLVFAICLLSNTKALGSQTVETVIVVRCCSPIAVAMLDFALFRKELPTAKGTLALLAIVGGALIYGVAGDGLKVVGYAWLLVYFVSIVIEMVFVKHVVDTVPMTTWTRVYYNNVLSLPIAAVSAVSIGDYDVTAMNWTPGTVFAVALSCVVGITISYAGFNLRKLVSATSFTVIGVVCKIFTVLMNDLIWSHHSNAAGHVGLLVCIGAGFMFERAKSEQQARLRAAGK